MIEFGDGPNLDASGTLRVEEKDGQFYVLGEGMMFPADDREAAEALLRHIANQDVYLNMKVLKSPSARARVNAVLEQLEKEQSGAGRR